MIVICIELDQDIDLVTVKIDYCKSHIVGSHYDLSEWNQLFEICQTRYESNTHKVLINNICKSKPHKTIWIAVNTFKKAINDAHKLTYILNNHFNS